jgi:hypothetical protein
MPRTTDSTGHAPEIDGLQPRPRVVDLPKESNAAPPAEAELLKRKPSVDATEALKAKGDREDLIEKQRLALGEAAALKQKLASAGEQKEATKLRENRSRARPRPAAAKRASVLRPIPDPDVEGVSETEEGARDGRATAAGPEECEVRWWRGYVKSHFFAVVTGADGTEATVTKSPSFRWHSSEPPPETPVTAAALRALVESLEREGWTVAGRGEDWFAVRLGARPA